MDTKTEVAVLGVAGGLLVGLALALLGVPPFGGPQVVEADILVVSPPQPQPAPSSSGCGCG